MQGSSWRLHLRVPDGTKGRNATALHGIDNLLRKRLIGDDGNGLSVEFLDKAEDELDHIGLSMLAGI